MSGQRVVSLVTGGTGFIGMPLVEALVARGDQVRVIGRRPVIRWRNHPGVDHIRADLGEEGVAERAVNGVDRVFHLAAATQGKWQEYQRVTIEGSARLLEAVAARGGGRIVFVSSLSVYGDRAAAEGTVIDEEAPIAEDAASRSSYARAKSAADSIAQKYLQGRDLRLTIVRPGIVYGPGMKNPLTGVALPLRGLGWLATGDRRKLLPLIYIDDLIRALILIAEKPEAVGKIFNLVQSEQPTHRAYLALYREVSGDRRPVLRLPLRASIPVLYALDWTLKHLRGTDSQMAQTVRRLTGRVVYSAQRARREVGFEAAIPITVGLRNAVARY